MENKILKSCLLDRASWELIASQELFKTEISTSKIIFAEITRYYKRDEKATSCDLDLVVKMLTKRYPKQEQLFAAWADRITKLEVSPSNISQYLASLKEARLLEEIQLAAQKGESKKVQLLSQSLLGLDIETSTTAGYESYTGADISSMLTKHRRENLVKLLPSALNDVLDGGIPRGVNTNILLFAETEIGKSLFAINMAYGFCRAGLKVVYINNEESVESMLIRAMCRFGSYDKVAITKQDVIDRYAYCHERAVAGGWGNLTMVPLGPGNISDLRTWASSGVDCVIVDQLLNLECGQDDSLAAKASVSKALRGIGKTNKIITVGLAQANIRKDMSGNIKHKLALDKGDVYGTNVAVPGDLDLMIGIGADHDFLEKNYRYLNICKNKISGRHTGFPVKILPQSSKVISL